MTPARAWDRFDGESAEHYDLFCQWLMQPIPRSVKSMPSIRMRTVAASDVKFYIGHFLWRERAEAYDEHYQEKVRLTEEQRLMHSAAAAAYRAMAETNEAQLTAIESAKLVDRARGTDVASMSVSDYTKVARLRLREKADLVVAPDNSEAMARMSDDELEVMQRALAIQERYR